MIGDASYPSVALQVEDVRRRISEHQISELRGIPVFITYDFTKIFI